MKNYTRMTSLFLLFAYVFCLLNLSGCDSDETAADLPPAGLVASEYYSYGELRGSPYVYGDNIYLLQLDGTLTVYNPSDGATVETTLSGWDGNVYLLAASPDGISVVTNDTGAKTLWNYIDGTLVSSVELTQLGVDYDTFLARDGENVVVGYNQSLYYYNSAGELTASESLDGELYWLGNITSSDKTDVCALTYDTGNLRLLSVSDKIRELDSIVLNPTDETAFDFACDESYIYICTEYGLMSYSLESGERVELCEWTSAGILRSSIYDLIIYNGEPLICGYNLINQQSVLLSLDEREGGDETRTKIVVYYLEDGTNVVPNNAIWFNSISEDFYIECVEYRSVNPSAEWDDLMTAFDLDIISGDIGDVLILPSYIDYSKYAKQGAFLDLYESVDFDFDSLYTCATEPFETTDGEQSRLYVIPTGFTLQTLFCKTDNLPDGEWNLDTFVELTNSGEVLLGGLTRDKFLSLLYNGVDSYFDLDTGSCNFDSDSFVRLLEFAASLPEMVEFNDDDVLPYRNDEILMYEADFMSFPDLLDLKARFGFDESITAVGYPSAGGGSAVLDASYYAAISSRTENVEGAWEFIEFMLSSDCILNSSRRGMRSIPSSRDVVRQWADFERGLYYYYAPDSLACRVREEPSADLPEMEGRIEIIVNDEIIAEYESVLDNVRYIDAVPDAVVAILSEEIEAYFAGVRDAEETAELIQGRASRYVFGG